MKGDGKMKKRFAFFLFILSCGLWPAVAQGIGCSLETAKDVYRPGDTILITAALDNTTEAEPDILLDCLLTSQTQKSPDRWILLPVPLAPSESKTVTLYAIGVTDDSPADEYSVIVKVMVNGILEQEYGTMFRVEGTLRDIDFDVHLCRDITGERQSRTFVAGEPIYISYESSVPGVQVQATVHHPDGSDQGIGLPGVLPAEKVGPYVLHVAAGKEGYKTSSQRVNFSVVQAEARIPETVLTDNFEDETADHWNLEPGWSVQQAYGNYVLSGRGHSWARLATGQDWTDYAFRVHVMLMTGAVHLNYRINNHSRYYVELRQEGLDLVKEAPWGNFVQLAASPAHHRRLVWHDVKIVGQNGHLQVYVNNSLEIDFIDSTPITQGSVAVEAVPDSYVHADNFELILFTVPDCLPSTHPAYDAWVALGKPDCWCWPYQCDGDADGVDSGFPFHYRVFTGDLAVVVANWKKKLGDPTLNPCADIDHMDSGFPFYYRVFTDDLSRVVTNWKKKDTQLPGNCPRPQ